MDLNFSDSGWAELDAGDGGLYDPRDALTLLESGMDDSAAWSELWERLYHQGAVGQASFASVPHLVRIHRARRGNDWNTYALVAAIELARRSKEIPEWLAGKYDEALRDLSKCAVDQLGDAKDDATVRAILAVIALSKGQRTVAEVILGRTEDELLEMLRNRNGHVS